LFRAIAFSVQWFGCRTFKRGAALVRMAYSTIQIECYSFQKKLSFVVAICCVIVVQDLQAGQSI